VIVHLDTSLLVDALTTSARSAVQLREALDRGHQLRLSTLALYEWLKGPRTAEQLLARELLFPSDAAIPFGHTEAQRAAILCHRLSRARGRIVDLAIAACALEDEAALWTLNRQDFADVPGLTLYDHD
jgi:predicted nucleic acid-binding protein